MLPTIAVGSLHVQTYPVLLLLAIGVGAWLGTRQAQWLGYDPDLVLRMVPWAAVAGIVGAKLYYLASFGAGGATGPWDAVRRSGMVWYGGLVAGTAVAAWRARRTCDAPLHLLFDYGVPCLAAANAVARVGCFMVGDDWGTPSTLPWAMAFPQGSPPSTAGSMRAMGIELPPTVHDTAVLRVHPTQLYEAAGLAVLAAVTWRMSRRAHRPWAVLATYCVGAGVLRFAVEVIRVKSDRLATGVTVAQLLSVALVLVGVGVFARLQGRAAPESVRAAPVARPPVIRSSDVGSAVTPP